MGLKYRPHKWELIVKIICRGFGGYYRGFKMCRGVEVAASPAFGTDAEVWEWVEANW